MPYPRSRMTIARENLNPAIRKGIDAVLESRRNRVVTPAVTAAFMVPINLFKVSNRAENLMLPAIAALAYKSMSAEVRKNTEHLGDTIRNAKQLDALGRISSEQMRETHPYAFVNRKGGLVLVPKKEMESALFHAQRTFLKHIVPGRYRVEL